MQKQKKKKLPLGNPPGVKGCPDLLEMVRPNNSQQVVRLLRNSYGFRLGQLIARWNGMPKECEERMRSGAEDGREEKVFDGRRLEKVKRGDRGGGKEDGAET